MSNSADTRVRKSTKTFYEPINKSAAGVTDFLNFEEIECLNITESLCVRVYKSKKAPETDKNNLYVDIRKLHQGKNTRKGVFLTLDQFSKIQELQLCKKYSKKQ